MRRKTYERNLPGGYKLAKKMDAKDVKFGLLLTLGSLLLFAVALVPCAVPMFFVPREAFNGLMEQMDIMLIGYFGGTLVYLVLHELTHGAAYKIMTGQKLTFGISWSCAFCGVPKIFTYRKTALIAVYAPFVLFTLLFVPALVWFYINNLAVYAVLALIFATHISGCIGDLYMGHVLIRKYPDRLTLVNDSGPCVTIFTFNPHDIGEKDYDTMKFIEKM